MAVLPLLLNIADELSALDRRPIFDDDFGFGIYPQEIRTIQRAPSLCLAYPRHRHCPYSLTKKKSSGKRKFKDDLSIGKDGFQVCMDVAQFKPNELTVKTVDNNIVVEGKHEEREDEHGFISRQFTRRYTLPKGYDPKEIVSTLSSDGVLTVKAPPPPQTKSLKGKERVVQIQETGPAHLSVKANQKEGEENEAKANGEQMED